MNKISIVIIVKNGAKTLSRTLSSTRAFDDVVVYDNGSTDETCAIAIQFGNVQLVRGAFVGFGETRNAAASHAHHDWILALDCDEVIDERLSTVLLSEPLDSRTIYALNFLAFYKNIPIKHCGWNHQKIRRLYHREASAFNHKPIHETLIDDGLKIAALEGGNIEHYSYDSISQFILKADRYSTFFAQNHVGKKSATPAKALLNAGFSFIKTYLFKRGFLDGYAGLLIAFSHMVTNFYKYLKLYELNREQR